MSTLQIYREKTLDVFEALPPRDRALAIGLLIFLFVGGIGWAMRSMYTSVQSQKQDIERLEDNLRLIQLLQQEQIAVKDEVTQIEQSLAKNATTDLSAFLEQAAKTAGFDPKEKNMQVREKSASTDGRLQEKVFSVSLSDITTEEFAKFLFQTETSGYPLQIQTTTVKTRLKQNEKVLNLTLDIAAYKLLETE